MDPDYSAYKGKDEGSLQALLDVTPEFSERRKLRAAIRALKADLSLHKPPPEAAPRTDHVTRRPSLVEGLRERRESLRKEQGTLVSGEGLQKELRLLEQARNPYDDVKDEQILTQLLKKSTELDDRVKIRAALRKLREETTNNANDTVSQGSPRSVKKISNGSSHNSAVEENGKKASCYSHIEDVHVLENMLSDVVDYDERKKIRGAIQRLRKQQLAAVAIKYSRNNSPDTVTSDTVDSDNVSSDGVTSTNILSEQSNNTMSASDPSHNPVARETVQSRLVVTLNNPANKNVAHSEPKEEMNDAPPLPTSPPPPPRVSPEEGSRDNRESPTLEDIEQEESRVLEKNLRNMEENSSWADSSEPPYVPVRTSSLTANRRAYPWTSTKVNLRVNGRAVSNASEVAPNSDSVSLSTDAPPSIETGNSAGDDSNAVETGSTSDEGTHIQDSPVETEEDCSDELQTVNVPNSLSTGVAVGDSPVTGHVITGDNADSDLTIPCDVTEHNDVSKPCDVDEPCDIIEHSNVSQTSDVIEPSVLAREDLLGEKVSSEATFSDAPSNDNSDDTHSDSTSISPPTQDGGNVDFEPPNTLPVESTKDCDKHSVVPPTVLPEQHSVVPPTGPAERSSVVSPTCLDEQTVKSPSAQSDSVDRDAAQPTAEKQHQSGSEKPLVTSIADAMEVLRGRLTYLEDELDSCENFDERREIRASIREVRAQIREETLKLSQQPTKGKAVLTKTMSTQEPARPGKPLKLTRSFSSKSQGRNFLARKLKCQLGRSNSTKATTSPVKEETSVADSDEPVFCAAPISRQYSRHDASTAPRSTTDSAPVSRSSSNVSTNHTGSAPVSRTSSFAGGSRTEGVSRNGRNSDNKRRFLSLEGRTLNMSKASSGYGSVSGSDEDKEEDAAPRITEPLSDVTHNDGETVTLTCKVMAGSKAKATWYKDSKLLKNSADFKQEFDGTTASLVITEIFPDDTGEYKCVVSTADGQAETIAYMTVLEEALEEHEAPDIVKALKNQEVLDGDQVTMTCGISGTPKPIITWYKDDKLLPNCTDFEQSYDGRTARLIIDEVFEDDTGEYKVVAKNVAGEVSMAALLDVRAKPGRPSGRAVSPPITVPTFTSRLQDEEVTVGSTATLTCCVRATPRPRVSWYHNGNLLRHSIARQSYDADSACLELPRVRREDSGKYECVARNDRGDARCTCTLQVNDVITGKSGFRSLSALTSEGRDLQALKARLEGMKNRFSDEPVNGSAQSRIKELQAKLDTTTSRKVAPSLTDYTSKMPDDKVDINSIDDEDELHKMMTATQDFEERKKLRNRMKEVREKKAGSDATVKLDQAKAKELKEKHFGSSGGESTTQTTKTDKLSDGSMVTTNVTTTRKTTKDGGTTTVTQTKQVTQKGTPGSTNYTIKKTSAVTSSSSTTGEKPGLTPGGEGKVAIQRSPSAIKDMLLQWCKICTKDYENVDITNFSSSWNNGMAFAALIHHFRPVFDYKKLNPKCRRGNFKLAFDVAEKFADIAPLLDVDDMVRMKNPDWKCVFTYVQSFYRKFRDEEGAPKPKAVTET